jgi:uncharacterized protein YbbK (DUF523 family)
MSYLSAIHLTKQRSQQPKVGISACLVGERVRYDGGDKYYQLINDELSPWLDLQVICPEVEVGLGTPRQPVHLVTTQEEIRGLGVEQSGLDVTNALETAAKQTSSNRCQAFCAYIVKSRSPSCGAGSTPIYYTTNQLIDNSDDLYVNAIKTANPST